MALEIVKAQPYLAKRMGSFADRSIPFPVVDEFFQNDWAKLKDHECDHSSEFCKNALGVVIPGSDAPASFDLSDSKRRGSLRHLIKNHGKRWAEQAGDTQAHIFPQIMKNEDGEWVITIARKCVVPASETAKATS